MSAVAVIERELDLDRCVPPAVLAREGKACLGGDLPTLSEISEVADKPLPITTHIFIHLLVLVFYFQSFYHTTIF